MLRIISKFIVIIIFITFLFPKEYLAIIDFSGINVSEVEASALTQRLISEMININKYQVIERSEMKRLLDEQKFQYSGCVSTQCAVDIGKLIGAKFMVVGSVSKVGSTYAVDARIIDVETAEANKSAIYEFEGKIDNLLSSGMLEIAKQLSIENYVYERNDKPSSTKNNKPKTDPNKVYDIADAGSIVLGDIDAKVTVIKWTDFQ